MDLQPTDLQELLRSNAEDVLGREAPSDRVREMERAGEPDAALWSTLVELGWTGLAVPEEHGGQGGSLLDLAVIVEQLCRFAVLTPFVPTTLAALVVQRHGDEALQAELLPRIAEGATVSIALAEGRGKMRDLAATFEDGAVSGEKHFVEYARSSDLHLVAASATARPGSPFVAAGADGVRIERDLASIGKTPQAIVVYEGAQADAWIEGEAAVEDLRRLGFDAGLAGVLRTRAAGARHDGRTTCRRACSSAGRSAPSRPCRCGSRTSRRACRRVTSSSTSCSGTSARAARTRRRSRS